MVTIPFVVLGVKLKVGVKVCGVVKFTPGPTAVQTKPEEGLL